MTEVTSITLQQQYLDSEGSSTLCLDSCTQTTGFGVSSRLSLVCLISHEGRFVHNPPKCILFIHRSANCSTTTAAPAPAHRWSPETTVQLVRMDVKLLLFIISRVLCGVFSHFAELVIVSELCGHVKLLDS